MKTEFMMKRLGNLINDESYDLPERFAPTLLDLGYVNFVRETIPTCLGICTCSSYQITDLGRKVYKEWMEKDHGN